MARTLRTPGAVQVQADEQPAVEAQAAELDLPNAIDIDARVITGPVLTRQGWVIPDEAWQKENKDALARLRAASAA